MSSSKEILLKFLSDQRIVYRVYGEHHHVAKPQWVQIDCPFCSPKSSRFRCGVNVHKLYCNCWHCGGLSLEKVLSELTGLSYREIRLRIGLARSGRKHPSDSRISPSESKEIKNKIKIPIGVGPLLKPHKEYLLSRGFDPHQVEILWGIKGIGIAPKLAWRIWIPIIHEGRAVSWTTRAIGIHQKRYISARNDEQELSPKRILYGEDYCRMSIVVTEGPTDVWRIGPGAVATMGLSITEEQLFRIAKYPLRVIALDNEKEAVKISEKVARRLKPFPGETIVVCLESGKDWGEADPQEVQELRRKFLDVS